MDLNEVVEKLNGESPHLYILSGDIINSYSSLPIGFFNFTPELECRLKDGLIFINCKRPHTLYVREAAKMKGFSYGLGVWWRPVKTETDVYNALSYFSSINTKN